MPHDTATVLLTAELGDQIAAHLTPGPWENVQDENYVEDYQRGRRLTLRYAGDDGTIAGAQLTALTFSRRATVVEWHCHMWASNHGPHLVDKLPYFERREWPGSSINISAGKPPERIGLELSRRLLSYYLPAYRAGLVGWQRELDEKAEDAALAAELASMAGTEAWQFNNQGGQPWRVNVGPAGMCRLTCEHGRVRVEGFSMSAEQAKQFLQYVTTWKE